MYFQPQPFASTSVKTYAKESDSSYEYKGIIEYENDVKDNQFLGSDLKTTQFTNSDEFANKEADIVPSDDDTSSTKLAPQKRFDSFYNLRIARRKNVVPQSKQGISGIIDLKLTNTRII